MGGKDSAYYIVCYNLNGLYILYILDVSEQRTQCDVPSDLYFFFLLTKLADYSFTVLYFYGSVAQLTTNETVHC